MISFDLSIIFFGRALLVLSIWSNSILNVIPPEFSFICETVVIGVDNKSEYICSSKEITDISPGIVNPSSFKAFNNPSVIWFPID